MGCRFPWIRGGQHGGERSAVLSPAIVATGLGSSARLASVAGNEAAIRFGRKRLIVTAMLASILLGGTIGFLGSTSYALAVVLITLYGVVIWLELVIAHRRNGRHRRALAPGRDTRRAFHAGLCGRICWPIAHRLDARSVWWDVAYWLGVSFLSVAVLMVLALITFWLIRPRELEGDRGKAS